MAGLLLSELRVGSVLAGYRVEGVVARGGMGVLYEARELASGRVVALKVLLPELSDDPTFRERFERESRIAMSLEHPHVVPVYGTGEAQGVLYIAMRLVPGVDLQQVIREVGPLPPERAVAIAEQVASGLDAAHHLGLVHRDVKPGNVMVESLGDHDHCYVMDFGLAKQAASTSFTQTGRWFGTLDYVAPEQILGTAVDARTDVYALGALLFAALTGRPPFPGGHDAAKIHAHLHSSPPAVSSVRPGLAAELDSVVARALAKAPEDRYQSGGDLGCAARAALTGGVPTAPERSVATGDAALAATVPLPHPVSAPTQLDLRPGAARTEQMRQRRRRWPALAAIAVLLALAGGVAALILTSGRSPQHRVVIGTSGRSPQHRAAHLARAAPPTRKPQPGPPHRHQSSRDKAPTTTPFTTTTSPAAQQRASAVVSDAQGVSNDLGALQGAIQDVPGTGWVDGVLRTMQKDLGLVRTELHQVLGEVGHVDSATLCTDANTVSTNANAVQDDFDALQSDVNSSGGNTGTITPAIKQLQSDQAMLDRDRSSDPADVPGSAPSDAQIAHAISAAHAKIGTASRTIGSAVSQARGMLSMAKGYSHRAEAACSAAGG